MQKNNKMRKLIWCFNLICLICINIILSQNTSLEKISYQGIARDAGGNILSVQPIDIQFIIHQGSMSGNPVFTEIHATTTNSLGLFTLEIGKNNPTQFQSIDWSNGPYFLEVQMDPTGGTSYTYVGTQQLLSVPYALYSKKAESVINTGIFTAWSTEGNYQTDSTLNFIGTKDNVPLIFKNS